LKKEEKTCGGLTNNASIIALRYEKQCPYAHVKYIDYMCHHHKVSY